MKNRTSSLFNCRLDWTNCAAKITQNINTDRETGTLIVPNGAEGAIWSWERNAQAQKENVTSDDTLQFCIDSVVNGNCIAFTTLSRTCNNEWKDKRKNALLTKEALFSRRNCRRHRRQHHFPAVIPLLIFPMKWPKIEIPSTRMHKIKGNVEAMPFENLFRLLGTKKTANVQFHYSSTLWKVKVSSKCWCFFALLIGYVRLTQWHTAECCLDRSEVQCK